MATMVATDPLLDELVKTEGKAEIINGKIVEIPLHGDKTGYATDEISFFLMMYVREQKHGRATVGRVGFLCDLPNRRSFSPDTAFYTGPSGEMSFFPEPPVFAVEVRSENYYGPKAEREMTQKRGDYFAAGTLVVWDVDMQNEEIVAKYSSTSPLFPQVFRLDEVADAEPAVPGWKMNVSDLLAPTS